MIQGSVPTLPEEGCGEDTDEVEVEGALSQPYESEHTDNKTTSEDSSHTLLKDDIPKLAEVSESLKSAKHLQRLKEAFQKSTSFIRNKVVTYRQRFQTSIKAPEQPNHSNIVGVCSEDTQHPACNSDDNISHDVDSIVCQQKLTKAGDGLEGVASSSGKTVLEIGMDEVCRTEQVNAISEHIPVIQDIKKISNPQATELNNNSIHPEDKENIPNDISTSDVIDDLPLGTEATNINGNIPDAEKRPLNLLFKRAKWLALKDQVETSVTSDSSQQTTASSSSGVDVILKERQVDPEQILYNLGFSVSGDFEMETDRIPQRFFQQQSTASGIDLESLLPHHPDISSIASSTGVSKTRGGAGGPLRRQTSLASVMHGLQFIKNLQGHTHRGPPSVPEEGEPQTVSILHPDNQKFLAEQGYYDQFVMANGNSFQDANIQHEPRKSSVSTEGSMRRKQFKSTKSTNWSLVESDERSDSHHPAKLILRSFTSGDSADSSDSAQTPNLSSLWRKYTHDVQGGDIKETNNDDKKSLKEKPKVESQSSDEVFEYKKQISNDSDSFLEREAEKISNVALTEVQDLSQNSFLSVKPSGVDASSDVGSDQTLVDQLSVHTETSNTGSVHSDGDPVSCKPNVSVIVSSNSGEQRYPLSVKKSFGDLDKQMMYPQESFEMEEISSSDAFLEDSPSSHSHSRSDNLPRMESSTSDSSGFADIEPEHQTDHLMPELDFVKRMERLGSSGESDRTLIGFRGNSMLSNPTSPSIHEEINEALSNCHMIQTDNTYSSDKNNNNQYFSSEKTVKPRNSYQHYGQPSHSSSAWKRDIKVTQTSDNMSKTTVFHFVDPSEYKKIEKKPEDKKFLSQCYIHVNANDKKQVDRKMPRQSSTNTDYSERGSGSSSSVGGYSGYRMGGNLNRTRDIPEYRSLPRRKAFQKSRQTGQSSSFDLLDSRFDENERLGDYGRSVSEHDLPNATFPSHDLRHSTPDRGHYFNDYRSPFCYPGYMLNVARGEYSSRNSLLDRSDGSSSGGSCYSVTRKPELQYAKLLRLVNQPGKYQLSFTGHSGIIVKPKHKTRYWKYLRKHQLLEEENKLVLGALYKYRSEILSLESSFLHQCNIADEDLSDDEREDIQEVQYLWSEVHHEVNEMERLMSIRTRGLMAGNEHFTPLKTDSVNIIEQMIDLLKEQIYQQQMNYCRDDEDYSHLAPASSMPSLLSPQPFPPYHYGFGNIAPSGGHGLEKSFDDLRKSLLGEIRSELEGKIKTMQTEMKDTESQVEESSSKTKQNDVQKRKIKEIKCEVKETEV